MQSKKKLVSSLQKGHSIDLGGKKEWTVTSEPCSQLFSVLEPLCSKAKFLGGRKSSYPRVGPWHVGPKKTGYLDTLIDNDTKIA